MFRLASNSLQSRLFIVFLSCMTGMVIVVSLLFYNRTTEQLNAKIRDLSSKNVSQTIGLFDLMDKGFDSLSKAISNNFDLVRLLNENPRRAARAIRYREIDHQYYRDELFLQG